MLEKTFESPLNCKEIQSVHSEGDQPGDFFGRNDNKTETPVLLPGESHGQRSLVGYSPWGRKESDTTEQLHLLLGRKVMTNLDSIFKSRDIDITLLTKVHLVKAMVFPVVMYGCESWIVKKAER